MQSDQRTTFHRTDTVSEWVGYRSDMWQYLRYPGSGYTGSWGSGVPFYLEILAMNNFQKCILYRTAQLEGSWVD